MSNPYDRTDPTHRDAWDDGFEAGCLYEEGRTCGCGIHIHPSRWNPQAIHISDCPWQTPASSKYVARAANDAADRIANGEKP